MLYRYSLLNALTGLARAARQQRNPIVSNATTPVSSSDNPNTDHPISTLNAKSRSQRSIAHAAKGQDNKFPISTGIIKSNERRRIRLAVLAPTTFRIPISRVRVSAA